MKKDQHREQAAIVCVRPGAADRGKCRRPHRLAKAKTIETGRLQGTALPAGAPLIGLACLILVPLIGFAVFFLVLGMGLVEKLGGQRAKH